MNEQYNEGWNQWDDMKVYGSTARHTRRFVLRLLGRISSFSSLLDIGCGTGLLLQEIHRVYPQAKLAGAEFSQRALEIAAQRVPQLEFLSLDLEKSPAPKTYDVVTCIDVLEHIPDDLAALKNLYLSTKQYLVISVPLGPLFPVETERYGHVRGYSRRDLETKIRDAGFQIVEAIQWGFPFYNLHRRLLNRMPADVSFSPHSYSWQKKLIAHLLYWVFFLNISPGGERYYALCERNT